jgi:hypothetical protein
LTKEKDAVPQKMAERKKTTEKKPNSVTQILGLTYITEDLIPNISLLKNMAGFVKILMRTFHFCIGFRS